MIIDHIQVIYIPSELGKITSVELLHINNPANLLSLVKISYAAFCAVHITFCIELGFFGRVTSFKKKKIQAFPFKKILSVTLIYRVQLTFDTNRVAEIYLFELIERNIV